MSDASILLDSMKESWQQILSFLPRVLMTLALLVIGLLVAKLLRRLALRLFRLIRLDEMAEKASWTTCCCRAGSASPRPRSWPTPSTG